MPSGSTSRTQKGHKDAESKDEQEGQHFKIVMRRLPRGFTEEELREQIGVPKSCSNFWFRKSNKLMDIWSYNRAYFVFKNWEDAISFKNKFNGYVFVDKQGNQSGVVVEMSVHQDAPETFSANADKEDRRVGTLENRNEYKEFLNEFNNLALKKVTNFDEMIREVEEKEKRAGKGMICETPLVKFLIQQAVDKEKKRIARLEKHKPALLQKTDNKLAGDKESKRNRRREGKKAKEETKQVDGAEKKNPEKPKRNEPTAKADKPKQGDDIANSEKPKRSDFGKLGKSKPEKPKRADDAQKPATANGTAPHKKRGNHAKSKEFAEFGNSKPKLLTRDSKNSVDDDTIGLLKREVKTTEKSAVETPKSVTKFHDTNAVDNSQCSIDKFLSNDAISNDKPRRHAQRPERQIYRPPARDRKEKPGNSSKDVET